MIFMETNQYFMAWISKIELITMIYLGVVFICNSVKYF